MTEKNKEGSADVWLYGQKKTKKSFIPEAYQKYWREREEQEKLEREEEEAEENE